MIRVWLPLEHESIMHEDVAITIQRALPGAEVRIESPDGTHFSAIVVSPAFEGMPLVRQHQMVMKALKKEFDSERLHALQLKTLTPSKWQALQEAQSSPLSVV